MRWKPEELKRRVDEIVEIAENGALIREQSEAHGLIPDVQRDGGPREVTLSKTQLHRIFVMLGVLFLLFLVMGYFAGHGARGDRQTSKGK